MHKIYYKLFIVAAFLIIPMGQGKYIVVNELGQAAAACVLMANGDLACE